MDANSFIVKLKGNGTVKELCDLEKVFEEYKIISSKLSLKDKGAFALNVLCMLCRNLDKIPQWRDSIDNKSLLILSIECVRGTRCLENSDRVKTLACIYHIHRHVAKQNTQVPPEFVLKFSYMAFECDNNSLISDCYKTYWTIIADRFTYIEKLKSNRIVITKLLPKLLEDLLNVIKIYDTVPFCANILVFVVKKLYLVFNDMTKEINEAIEKVFDIISKQDLGVFKGLKDEELMDLYMKFNECFVVMIENSLKVDFKGLMLNNIVKQCISMLGHNSSIFHCLQTFILNSFCYIFNEKAKQDSSFIETILKNLVVSCETAEKLGYKMAMYATYPFLYQSMRIYIESLDIGKMNDLAEEIQISCLKFIFLLMKKLKNTNQMLKCENCSVKSGLHDALRLSFLAKNFTSSIVNLKNVLPYYCTVVENQYLILYELKALGCSNFPKCFRKLQTDIHNTAISLNKSQYFECSIKIFDIYLANEVKNFSSESTLKNISRGLYNKSICQVDCNLYEQALKDAYLSMLLAHSEPSTDKYMMLVMDIKAKMIKNTESIVDNENSASEDNQDYFQMLTVCDVTRIILDGNPYGDLRPFVKNAKFSTLLKHEFSMYVKLWPSILPIVGVWRSINDIIKEKHNDWMPVKEKTTEMMKILYEIVLETPTAARTVHTDYCKEITLELVENLEEQSEKNFEEQMFLATLLFLKAEYDLTEASEKYAWRVTGNIVDPDSGQAIRTIPQEHNAMKSAVKAVELWTKLIKQIRKPLPWLHHALQIAEMFVQQFLHMQMLVHGLQLAGICCELALCLNARESFVRNAGVIISYAERKTVYVDSIIKTATAFVTDLVKNEKYLDICLSFMCEIAIYYKKQDMIGVSAKLLNFVQSRILEAYEAQMNVNLDLAIGRLMEAQFQLFDGKNCDQTVLSVVNNIQKHYFAIGGNGTSFTSRRTRALLLKHRSSASGLRATSAAYSLRLYRRARATAAATLPRSAAVTQAYVYGNIVNVSNVDDTQTKINDCLKHILGLQPTNETQTHCLGTIVNVKEEPFTPKTDSLETMLESMTFRKNPSPTSLCLKSPPFKMPEFFRHKSETCNCYGCETILADVIACYTCGLEASKYFRANEFEVARGYYEGALRMFEIAESRFKHKMAAFKTRKYNQHSLDIVGCIYRNELRQMLVQLLIDASYFELAQRDFVKSDELVIRIHEVMSEMRDVDRYLRIEIYNLMITSAQLRKVVANPNLGIETDFEALNISPDGESDLPKTPESKYVPVEKTIAKVVNADEVPNFKRKVIKLNLDKNVEDVETIPDKTITKKTHFKVPVPVIMKPAFENITPRPTRSKPGIIVTQSSEDVENTPKAAEFFTPQSTPSNELFFTPMTSIKTYKKRSGIVKNLEAEFSTPKAAKIPLIHNKGAGESILNPKTAGRSKGLDENGRSEKNVKATDKKDKTKEGTAKEGTLKEITTKHVDSTRDSKQSALVKSLRDKRSLKRATSPGKIVKEEKLVTRSRRRQPILDA